MMDPHSLTLYSRRVTIRRRDSRHALLYTRLSVYLRCAELCRTYWRRDCVLPALSLVQPPPLSIATPFSPGWANESTVAVPAFVATPLAAAACTAAHVPRAWI